MVKKFKFLLFLMFILFISIASASATYANDIDLNDGVSLNNNSFSDVGNYGVINNQNFNTLNIGDNESNNNSNISKNSTIIKTSNVQGYLTTSTYVSAVLMDSNGDVLYNKTILISGVNGKTYKLTTNINGLVKLKIPAKIGTSNVVFRFVGDDMYYGSSGKSKVVISKMKTQLIVPVVRSNIENSTYLSITLKDVNGKVLSKKKVYVKIKGKTYSLTTNTYGKAKLKIASSIGTFNAVITYYGSSYYAKSSVNSKVIITKVPTSIIVANSSYYSKNYGYLYITLKDVKGKVLKNKIVYAYISSLKKTYKLTTNSKGVASLKFYSLKNSSVKVKFNGDKTYLGNSVNSKINVNLVKLSIKDIISSSLNFRNYIINNSKLPSTIEINGVKYTNPQFTYLMALAIKKLDDNSSNIDSEIILPLVNAPPSPSGGFFYKNISNSNYLKLASSLVSFADSNYRLPNYVSLSSNKVDSNLCSYEFSEILSNYTGSLPYKITLNSSVFINKPKDGNYALTCLNWGSGGDITKNKVLMNNIKRTTLANKIIAMCKKGTPIIAFGDGDGPVVIVNSGVHGNELSSQAATFKLIEKLASMKNIKGTIYVIPVLSPRSTAANVRDYNGIKLNTLAGTEGTISNNLIKLALAVGAEGLGDFHCTRHGGDPGKNVAMGSYLPNEESAILAKYIASKTNVATKIYNLAGAYYPGAVEDEANINGITSVTCEVLTNHGTIEKGTVSLSYSMMLYFLKYFGNIS